MYLICNYWKKCLYSSANETASNWQHMNYSPIKERNCSFSLLKAWYSCQQHSGYLMCGLRRTAHTLPDFFFFTFLLPGSDRLSMAFNIVIYRFSLYFFVVWLYSQYHNNFRALAQPNCQRYNIYNATRQSRGCIQPLIDRMAAHSSTPDIQQYSHKYV